MSHNGAGCVPLVNAYGDVLSLYEGARWNRWEGAGGPRVASSRPPSLLADGPRWRGAFARFGAWLPDAHERCGATAIVLMLSPEHAALVAEETGLRVAAVLSAQNMAPVVMQLRTLYPTNTLFFWAGPHDRRGARAHAFAREFEGIDVAWEAVHGARMLGIEMIVREAQRARAAGLLPIGPHHREADRTPAERAAVLAEFASAMRARGLDPSEPLYADGARHYCHGLHDTELHDEEFMLRGGSYSLDLRFPAGGTLERFSDGRGCESWWSTEDDDEARGVASAAA